jgi:hypothetical protein
MPREVAQRRRTVEIYTVRHGTITKREEQRK